MRHSGTRGRIPRARSKRPVAMAPPPGVLSEACRTAGCVAAPRVPDVGHRGASVPFPKGSQGEVQDTADPNQEEGWRVEFQMHEVSPEGCHRQRWAAYEQARAIP
eukprot:4723267-Prymnesium_polylepis.1